MNANQPSAPSPRSHMRRNAQAANSQVLYFLALISEPFGLHRTPLSPKSLSIRCLEAKSYPPPPLQAPSKTKDLAPLNAETKELQRPKVARNSKKVAIFGKIQPFFSQNRHFFTSSLIHCFTTPPAPQSLGHRSPAPWSLLFCSPLFGSLFPVPWHFWHQNVTRASGPCNCL